MIVIDASVANKLVLPYEEGHIKVKEIFQNHSDGLERIISLDLLLYEVANTLATKATIPQRAVTRSITIIYKTQIEIYHPTEDDVKEAARLAKKYKTSVYDMLYAVVAKANGTILITADEQFIKQTKFKFVKLL
ncbi:type II toxin-antitoxin system VapC family toxin [Candidatus Microgenomates bacterium]|nr:type II toxin-antitoxin system VapC family toxin [Candidatus Microgenomates bacterium]